MLRGEEIFLSLSLYGNDYRSRISDVDCHEGLDETVGLRERGMIVALVGRFGYWMVYGFGTDGRVAEAGSYGVGFFWSYRLPLFPTERTRKCLFRAEYTHSWPLSSLFFRIFGLLPLNPCGGSVSVWLPHGKRGSGFASKAKLERHQNHLNYQNMAYSPLL